MKFIGIDAGSVSVKVVVLDNKGNRVFSAYKRHRGQSLHVALELLEEVKNNELIKKREDLHRDWSLSITV